MAPEEKNGYYSPLPLGGWNWVLVILLKIHLTVLLWSQMKEGMKEQKKGLEGQRLLWISIFLSQYWWHKIFRREKTETCSNPNLGNLTLFLLTLAVTLKVQWCDILVWNILILAFDCDRNLKTVIGVKLYYGISIWWYPPDCVCNHSCMLLKYSRIQEGL